MSASASRYHEVYEGWRRDPEGFWGDAAQDIDWYESPAKTFDPSAGVYGRWFVGGVCNTCWNAVDRHVVGGRGNQPALIYDSPVTGAKLTDKFYHQHTGYMGNLKSISLGKLLKEHPERALEFAVKGMLPKNTLGRKMFRKLHVFAGGEHPHSAQQPKSLDL